MGEPGDGFQAEAPREVIPFNPRANEVFATRNGFERGRNTATPCPGGTCFHAVPNAPFEGGKGIFPSAAADGLRRGTSAIPGLRVCRSLMGATIAWHAGNLASDRVSSAIMIESGCEAGGIKYFRRSEVLIHRTYAKCSRHPKLV